MDAANSQKSKTHMQLCCRDVIGGIVLAGAVWMIWTVQFVIARHDVADFRRSEFHQRAPSPIDINTAEHSDLRLLEGVGPALADRILADRAARGRFTSIDDLDRVKGIGPKFIARNRAWIETR